MTAKAAADVAAVLGAYGFGRFGTIADIGGGRGHLLRAILDVVPTAEGILFELPDVVATLHIDSERLTAQAGDFFVDPLPAADAYILMEVIHDWADAEAAAILRAIRRAAPADAAVLIIEGVVIEDQTDPRVQRWMSSCLPSREDANAPPASCRNCWKVPVSVRVRSSRPLAPCASWRPPLSDRPKSATIWRRSVQVRAGRTSGGKPGRVPPATAWWPALGRVLCGRSTRLGRDWCLAETYR
ncbi:hypothetical protein BH24ACT12_BH24ACT12_22360 [soil metagenome]